MEFIPACSLVAVYLKTENVREEEYRHIIGQFANARVAANVGKMFADTEKGTFLARASEVDMPDHFYMIVDPGAEEFDQYEDLEMIYRGVYSL